MVNQNTQRDSCLVKGDGVQPDGGEGGDGHRGGISGIAFAAVSGGQQPDPGGELGRHVHHGDAVFGQASRQRGTQATGAFDRPTLCGHRSTKRRSYW